MIYCGHCTVSLWLTDVWVVLDQPFFSQLYVHHLLTAHICLQGYEIPRDFVVELEPFSKINHLLTDSGKPARGKLKAKCVYCDFTTHVTKYTAQLIL